MQYRLMNEYGVDWPFWDEDGQCAVGVPRLPLALATEVSAWAAEFNDHYGVDAGWPTERAARVHERQAHRLLRLVERALPEGDTVVLGLWETNRRKGL